MQGDYAGRRRGGAYHLALSTNSAGVRYTLQVTLDSASLPSGAENMAK